LIIRCLLYIDIAGAKLQNNSQTAFNLSQKKSANVATCFLKMLKILALSYFFHNFADKNSKYTH